MCGGGVGSGLGPSAIVIWRLPLRPRPIQPPPGSELPAAILERSTELPRPESERASLTEGHCHSTAVLHVVIGVIALPWYNDKRFPGAGGPIKLPGWRRSQ